MLAFRLFGQSIGAARTLESILKLSAWLFLALFLGRLFKRRLLYAFGLLTLLALAHVSFLFNLYASWFAPSLTPEGIVAEFQKVRWLFETINFLIIRSDDLCTFLFAWALVGVIGAGKEQASNGGWSLKLDSFLFGFVPTASLAYSVDRGVYLTAACLVLGLYFQFVYFKKHPFGKDFRSYSSIGGIGGLLALGILLKGDYADFMRFVFLQMPLYKELSEKVPYPIHSPLFLLVLVCYALNLFWIVRDGWKEAHFSFGRPWMGRWMGNRGIEISLLVLSIFYFRSALARSDWQHVIYSVAFLGVLSFWILLKELQAYGPKWGWDGRRAWAVVGLLGGIVAISCFHRLVREPVFERNFPFQTADKAFVSSDQEQTLVFLRSVMGPGDRFFTFSSNACWYYLLGQASPTRFPYIWIAALPVFQQEVTRDLEKNQVKWVLYKEDEWYDQIDGVANETKFPIISGYLRTHYHPSAKVGGDEIWEKN